jgi:hypothetical protein
MTEFPGQHTITSACPLSCLEDQLPARAFRALKRHFQGQRSHHPTVGDVADLCQHGCLGEIGGLGACGIQRIVERLKIVAPFDEPTGSGGLIVGERSAG